MKMSELTERKCAFCGDTFMPNTPRQIYDVYDCRYRAARQKAYERRQAERNERAARLAAAQGLAALQ